jgi:hypothetical protein
MSDVEINQNANTDIFYNFYNQYFTISTVELSVLLHLTGAIIQIAHDS